MKIVKRLLPHSKNKSKVFFIPNYPRHTVAMRLTTVKEENRAQAWDKPLKMLKIVEMLQSALK